jgi:hypothetical protein
MEHSEIHVVNEPDMDAALISGQPKTDQRVAKGASDHLVELRKSPFDGVVRGRPRGVLKPGDNVLATPPFDMQESDRDRARQAAPGSKQRELLAESVVQQNPQDE